MTAEIRGADGLPPGYLIIGITVMPSESLVKAGQASLTVNGQRHRLASPEKGGRQGVLKSKRTLVLEAVLMTKATKQWCGAYPKPMK